MSIEVDVLVDGIDFHTRVSRARFEDLCASLFLETLEPVKRALEDAKLTKEVICELLRCPAGRVPSLSRSLVRQEVDDVVLVGGSIRIPKVQTILQKFFGGKQLNLSINPDEAVAQGAAVQVGKSGAAPSSRRGPRAAAVVQPARLDQAAILAKDDSWVIRNLVLRDVIPLSLGIGLEDGGMKRIVERNTRIPCQRQGGTKTCVDNQVTDLKTLSGQQAFIVGRFLQACYWPITIRSMVSTGFSQNT